MKILKRFFLIIFLLIILIYVTNITSIPDNIVLFKKEELDLNEVFGIYLKKTNNNYQSIQTSTTANIETAESTTITLSLFNLFDVKDVNVDIIPKTTVIPLGNTVGLKLYTTGVLVVGKSEIEGKKPYENTNIEEGDLIVCINEQDITCTAELIETVNNSNGNELQIKYIRDGQEHFATMEPAKTNKDQYKLGLWVRDGAAGIGTITYYEPATKKFAALGHGIIDIDTEKLINIDTGELVTTSIISIEKGKEGFPGEIKGTITSSQTIGNVSNNTEFGIYGTLTNIGELNINNSNELEIATRDEIQKGPAKIIMTLENENRKEYNIEITKIYKNNETNNKSMLIKVTDEKLLELTGGIVQRNEWSTNNTKRKIHRSSNTCISK